MSKKVDTDTRLIRLAAGDNILVLATGLSEGTTVRVEGVEIILDRPLSLGHKIAARAITAGETVLKYNFPIGIATEDIPVGTHVHVHNVRSDYTPSYIIPES